MCKERSLAVVGATGLVGRTILKILEERDFPVKNIRLFASDKSAGKELLFRKKTVTVEKLCDGCFENCDIAIFSAGASVSAAWAEKAEKAGAYVIDNSSAWRRRDDCALVVPEINAAAIRGKRRIIANPNCGTVQVVLPIFAIEREYGLKRASFVTFQAVSGSGKRGLDDLFATRNGEKPSFYPVDISETCLPKIGGFSTDGYTEEELKMIYETRKILSLPSLPVSATCVRVPVKNCHAVAASVVPEKPFTLSGIRNALKRQSGIKLLDDVGRDVFPTSAAADGKDEVFVGRIRRDLACDNGLLFYCVADNLRKGAALNAVQIAETLIW